MRRYEEAGGDCVATDTRAGKVGCQPLGKVGDARLCRAVRGDFREGRVCVHGRNVEDAAAFIYKPCVKKYCK